MLMLGPAVGALLSAGCAHHRAPAVGEQPSAPPQVVVVAPVLNLSNSTDWDPLKVTDIVASELQSFPGIFVIPVNRTLAALALMGKDAVETPQDAIDLANEFNADATIVTAITEYNPYDPPIIGLLMQWYAPPQLRAGPALDPVSASREASEIRPAASAPRGSIAPLLQVQRVYNAAEESVLADVRSFGARRHGQNLYGWRVHLKSQELFVRYCSWATIRTMLLARESSGVGPRADETKQWTDREDV